MATEWEPVGGPDWYLTREAAAAHADMFEHTKGRPGPFALEGVYHPHVPGGPGVYPIEIDSSWLGQTYLSRIGGCRAEVSLPRAHNHKGAAGPGLAPPLFANDPGNWDEWTFPSEPESPKWGQAQAGTRTARITAFRIAIDSEDDRAGLTAAQVFEDVGEWWAIASSWIEVLSEQDLRGGDRFHWSSGTLNLWSPGPNGRRDHWQGSRLNRAVRLKLHDGYIPFLGMAFQAAGLGHMPPAEWRLLRDAQSLFERGQYSRSAGDSGRASEQALIRYLHRTKHPDVVGKTRTPTLGALAQKEREHAKSEGQKSILPAGFEEIVVKFRNDFAHRRADIGEHEAAATFELSKALVESILPRQFLTETYGVVTRNDPPIS